MSSHTTTKKNSEKGKIIFFLILFPQKKMTLFWNVYAPGVAVRVLLLLHPVKPLVMSVCIQAVDFLMVKNFFLLKQSSHVDTFLSFASVEMFLLVVIFVQQNL